MRVAVWPRVSFEQKLPFINQLAQSILNQLAQSILNQFAQSILNQFIFIIIYLDQFMVITPNFRASCRLVRKSKMKFNLLHRSYKKIDKVLIIF